MNTIELVYMNGDKLSDQQLKEIAVIDNKIPLEFDPFHETGEAQTLSRVEHFRELIKNGFFCVAFTKKKDIIAFHAIHKKMIKLPIFLPFGFILNIEKWGSLKGSRRWELIG